MNDHAAVKALTALGAGVATLAIAITEVIENSVNTQAIAGWAFGTVGLFGLGYRVWTERNATIRADATMEARIKDMKEQLAEEVDEKIFWRDKALASGYSGPAPARKTPE